jgi:hypothetical protein
MVLPVSRFLDTVNTLKAKLAVGVTVIALMVGGAGMALATGGGSTHHGGNNYGCHSYASHCEHKPPPRCHWEWKKIQIHWHWIWWPVWVCERR